MAFKVMPDTGLEDDEVTVVIDANSYVSVDAFLAYFIDRNVDYTDKEPEELQAALIAATDYIEARFANRFRGVRLNNTQSLSWPRRNSYDLEGYGIDGIPTRLKNAVYEYASRALTAALAPDFDGDRTVRASSETVGPIRDYKEYFTNPQRFKKYPLADSWLESLVTAGGGGTIR